MRITSIYAKQQIKLFLLSNTYVFLFRNNSSPIRQFITQFNTSTSETYLTLKFDIIHVIDINHYIIDIIGIRHLAKNANHVK